MKQKLIILTIILLTLSVASYADDKPITLTDTEQREWSQFAAVEKARADTLTQAANDLLNTQPGPDSVTVHARYQSAWLSLSLVRSQRGEWLAKLQAARGCAECQVGADGKSFTKPETKQ